MKYAATLGLLILTVFTVACSSGINTANPLTMTGPWNFQLTSSTLRGASYTASAKLVQSNNTVKGLVTFSNSPCASSGILTGAISGYTVTFQITQGGQTVTLIGTINSVFQSMSGSFSASSGGCLNGDFGSWSASG